jgi:hypothetical protein
VDYSGIHSWRDHVSGRLQEEATATPAATATAAAGAHSVDLGQSE